MTDRQKRNRDIGKERQRRSQLEFQRKRGIDIKTGIKIYREKRQKKRETYRDRNRDGYRQKGTEIQTEIHRNNK